MISDILNLTSILVIIVMLYALRYKLLKLVREIDEKNYTAGDYTALVENINISYPSLKRMATFIGTFSRI